MVLLRWLIVAGVCSLAASCYAERRDTSANTGKHAAAEPKAAACDAGSCEDAGADSAAASAGKVPVRCAKLAPEDNPAAELCALATLQEFCERSADAGLPCPETIDDVEPYLCDSTNPRQIDRYYVACNACGGLNAWRPRGFGQFYFSFGADGMLVGVTLREDTPGACDQFERVHGTFCPDTEEPTQVPLVGCDD
jgi:hypothetical protein